MIEALAVAGIAAGGALGGAGVARLLAVAMRWDCYRAWSLRRLGAVVGVMCVVAATAGEAHAEPPAAQAEGYWNADVRMSSTVAKTPQANYWWVGQMWGRIERTGKVLMRAENGCIASGALTDKSFYEVVGEVEVSGCQERSMNRRYQMRVGGLPSPMATTWESVRISFRTAQNGGGNGLLDTWAIEGAFVPYTPKQK